MYICTKAWVDRGIDNLNGLIIDFLNSGAYVLIEITWIG